jgi:CheY-like chemotaxis protein
MFESGSWNLILMDCQMPFLDGYELTRRIRQREREHGQPPTPIVAMTAHAMPGDRDHCLAVGMDDYLAKPITLSALDEILDRWLEGRVVVDPDRIEELRALLPGAETGAFLAALQESVEHQLQEIEQALNEGNLGGARESAHSILGSARMLGAEPVTAAARALESAADLLSAQAAGVHLRESWKELRETLATRL